MKSFRKVLPIALVFVLLLIPTSAMAQDSLEIMVTASAACGEATFQFEVQGGEAPYSIDLVYGDGESVERVDVLAFPAVEGHSYPSQGQYEWSLMVTDRNGITGSAAGVITIEGPQVNLNSDPFPPLLMLETDQASINFTAEVQSGVTPYSYSWDLDGNGIPDTDLASEENTASFTYGEAGKYEVSVTVADACGLTGIDTLPVVVIDPESDEICHPMAQRIADGVNTLFPNQAEKLYTCEDILAIFMGELTGDQVGFGRLWHAYTLSLTIEDLTWEEIRDWHLDGNGWGLLTQLDRMAELVDEVGITDLMELVLSGENTVSEIRAAARAVVRYEADFEDALSRLAAGASPGEIQQLYRLAQELEIDPAELDDYLESGIELSELRHAAMLADQMDLAWEQVMDVRSEGFSWGEIKQAVRLADETMSADEILEIGIHEYRQQTHESKQVEKQSEQQQHTITQIMEKYGVSEEEVLSVYNGVCVGDWSCVRAHFHDQANENRGKGNK